VSAHFDVLSDYEITHLVYHLRHADAVDPLGRILTDLGFFAEVLRREALRTVLADATTATDVVPDPAGACAVVAFLRTEADTLTRHPGLLLQQAANQPSDSVVERLADQPPGPWLRWLNKPSTEDARALVIRPPRDPGLTHWIMDCAWLDRERVIAVAETGRTTVWDVSTGELVEDLPPREPPEHRVARSPDGTRVVELDDVPEIRQVATDTVLGRLGSASWVTEEAVTRRIVTEGHRQTVRACAWSPDGRWIATGSGSHYIGMPDDDFSVRIWDAATFAEVHVLEAHRDAITALAFSPDSTLFASCSGSVNQAGPDNSSRIWNVASGEPVSVLRGHVNEVVHCAWSPDGDALVSCGKDGMVIVWRAPALVQEAPPGGAMGAVSPDGRLAALLDRADVPMVDVATGREIHRLSGHTDLVACAAFSPDGNCLATGAEDRTVRLWNPATGEFLAELRGHEDHGVSQTYVGQRQVWGAVTSVAWSADGALLASSGSDRLVLVWSSQSRQLVRRLQGHIGPVAACAWYGDDHLVSAGDSFEHIQDHSIRLWSVPLGAELGVLDQDDPIAAVLGPAMTNSRRNIPLPSPDGTRTAVKTGEALSIGALRVVRAGTTHELTVEGTAGSTLLTWLPDGRHLAVATDVITVIDTDTMRPILTFPAPAPEASLTATRDGKLIAVDDAGHQLVLAIEGLPAALVPPKSRPVRAPVKVDEPRQPDSATAWLHMLRGLIINNSPEEVLKWAAAQVVTLDTTKRRTFTAALDDPYSTDIGGINADLWELIGTLTWSQPNVAARCLRTALAHNPNSVTAQLLLGWLYLARGQARQAKNLLAAGDRAERQDLYHLAEDLFLESGALQLAKNLRRHRDQFL